MHTIYILGSVNMDLVVSAPKMPDKGETLIGSSFLMNPGGKGANQAVAVSLAGGKANMIGIVGHAFGTELIETLEHYRVDTINVRRCQDISSGVAVIVLSEDDNRIIVDPGANALVDENIVDFAFKGAQPGDYVLAQLEIPLETIAYAFRKAHDLGMITCLNVAPARQLPEYIFTNVDYFFANQTETEFYTGILPDDKEKAETASLKLIEKGVKRVVITMGKAGSYYYEREACHFGHSYKVKVVDTTAAGDTYIGSFVARVSSGANIKEAMDYASAAAAISVTRPGAQQSIPTYDETIAFIKDNECQRK